MRTLRKFIIPAVIAALLGGFGIASGAPTSTYVQNLFITALKSSPTSSLVIGANGLVATTTLGSSLSASDTQILYANGGVATGDSNFVWSTSSQVLNTNGGTVNALNFKSDNGLNLYQQNDLVFNANSGQTSIGSGGDDLVLRGASLTATNAGFGNCNTGIANPSALGTNNGGRFGCYVLPVTSTAGNWMGTWQGFNNTDFAPSTTVSSMWTATSTGIFYNGGFVGINTATPAANLEVNGTALFDATTTLPSGIWRGDGKVAIGTTNPHGLPLYVAGGGIGIDNTQAYDVTDASGTVRTTFGMTNQNVLFLKNNANGTGGPLQIYSGATSTQGITISLAGNVGIGTNSPNNLFHVVASVASTSDMGILFQNTDGGVGDTATLYLGTRAFQGNTAGDRLVSSALRTTRMTAGGSNDLSFLTSSGTVLTENMRLTAAGNLGIGTTAPSTTLQVATTVSSTIRVGMSGNVNNSGCFELYDHVNSTTLMYLYPSSGALVVTSTKPTFCQ